MSHVVSSSNNVKYSSDRVTIVARRTDGWTTSHELRAGESVLIGTDDQCRFRLTGERLSPKHCLFRFVDGDLAIQDWCSDTGTIVDGRPIDSVVRLLPEANIQIGEYTLQLRTEQATEEHLPEDACSQPVLKECGGSTPSIHPSDWASQLDSQSNSADEADIVEAAADLWDDSISAPSIDRETFQLLRAEVELLQSELAERDFQLAELSEYCTRSEQKAHVDRDVESKDQRLRTLLEELEHSDQRICALEHTLRLSEEATLAEMEERRQVDAWVRDIEDRIGQREAEWKAEQQALNRQLSQIVEERDRFRQKVRQVSDGNRVEPALKDVVSTLQSDNSVLKSRIAAEETRNEALTKRCDELEEKVAAGYQQRQVDDAIRAERLQLAQERAELSRLRAELTNKLRDAHRDANQDERISSADQKFLAFRKHLRDIHEEEKAEHTGPTLPERLMKLWRRLDGPTDTD